MRTEYDETTRNRSRSAGVRLLALLCASSAFSLWATTCWTTTMAPCKTDGSYCDVHSPNCPGVTYTGYTTNALLLGAWVADTSGYWNTPTTNAECTYTCQMYPALVDCRGQNVSEGQTNNIAVPDTSNAGTPNCPGGS